jgi:hypothetical protein
MFLISAIFRLGLKLNDWREQYVSVCLPIAENIPICVHSDNQSIRVDITLAVKYGGAETIMVGPPEQIEIL